MFRIDDVSAAIALPVPEVAGAEGYWTEGNPGLGVPATLERASWFNMIQEELRGIVMAGGLAPSKTTYNQVLQAINILTQNTGSINSVAGGTTDAITGAYTPAITALVNGMALYVRAGSANSTTTPTFKADGTAIKTIVKGNNLPLVAGDIAGAGHWLELQYDLALDKWVLQNPAVPYAGFGKALSSSGYQKLPSGLIIQWGSGTTAGGGGILISNAIAFPNAVFTAVATANAVAVAANILSVSPTLTATTVYASNGSGAAIVGLGAFYIAIGY
jgi:hypothetical protein